MWKLGHMPILFSLGNKHHSWAQMSSPSSQPASCPLPSLQLCLDVLTVYPWLMATPTLGLSPFLYSSQNQTCKGQRWGYPPLQAPVMSNCQSNHSRRREARPALFGFKGDRQVIPEKFRTGAMVWLYDAMTIGENIRPKTRSMELEKQLRTRLILLCVCIHIPC